MGGELSVSEIERIVLSDPHIKRIVPAEEWDIPKIDLALWSESCRRRMNKSLRYLIDFLGRPYIIDDFETDDGARRQWRMGLTSKQQGAYEYLKNSALSATKIQGVNHIRQLKSDYTGTNISMLQDELSQIPIPGPEYVTWSTEKKKEVVCELKVKIYGFLKFLSQQSPAS